MRSSVTIDQKHRNHVMKTEKSYLILKAISQHQNDGLVGKSSPQGSIADAASILLDRNPFTRTKIRRRCVVTGRGKGVYRRFKRSRIKVREGALRGHLACVRKVSF
jgi:small subunit ribosomal protein S14